MRKLSTSLAAVLVAVGLSFVATPASASASGVQTGGGYTLFHQIQGSGRSATLQTSEARSDRGNEFCNGRIDFSERDAGNTLLRRSTGTTVNGCLFVQNRERVNVTFLSNTSRACASLYTDGSLRVTQCHGISG